MDSARAAEPVDDDRYFVVGGRRWRRTDPAIPHPLRQELVNELMAARRVPDRPRVHDAKVALGERGRPWWAEDRDEGADRARLAAAMRSLLRARSASSSICPSDGARVAGGLRWRSLLPAAREVARELARNGSVVITQADRQLDPNAVWRGPVRIRLSDHD